MINIQAIEHAVLRALIFELAIGILVTILLFWATYWVIKAGVRDGISEATPRHPPEAIRPAPHGYKWVLVPDESEKIDLRADR